MMNKIRANIVSILLIISILTFLITGGIVIFFSNNIINSNQEIAYVSKLYETFEEVRITLRSVIISQRNYLLTEDKGHLLNYAVQKEHLIKQLDILSQMDNKDYIDKSELSQLDTMIRNKLNALDDMIDLENQDKTSDIEKILEEESIPIFESIQNNASKIENSLESVTAEFRISSQKDARIANYSIYTGYSFAFIFLFISFFSLQRQIIRRKKAENELRIKSDTLAEINAEKDKFFSILAHDLKNPLGASLGLMDLLKEALLQKDFRQIEEISELILSATKKTFYLLENLLEWARIQTGRLVPSKQYFNILKIINETYELLNSQITKKGIRINLPTNLTFAFADSFMVQTAFRNILSNAVKFTPENGLIDISLQTDEDNIIIKVSDNGCGLKENEIPLLFRLDIHSSNIGDGTNKGTGLGLIIAKELIVRNNGDIWVESVYGKGTTFFIKVPKVKII